MNAMSFYTCLPSLCIIQSTFAGISGYRLKRSLCIITGYSEVLDGTQCCIPCQTKDVQTDALIRGKAFTSSGAPYVLPDIPAYISDASNRRIA
jgi:hypothetical protein